MAPKGDASEWATTWREILEVARWAPSPHNTQPWKVRLTGGAGAELFLDRDRALPDEDLTGCFVVAALGMFIETISCLAANRHLRLDVGDLESAAVRMAASHDGLESTDRLVLVARLELSRDPDVAADLSDELILERRTSRLTPTSVPIEKATLVELEAEAARGGQHIHLVEAEEQVRDVMRLNLAAVVEDLNTPSYHREIVSWFRPTRRHEREARDGLSARCMAMPGYEMKLLGRSPGLAKLPLIGRLVRAQYQRRLGGVPRLMVLEGPFWDGAAALRAGRCLMRLWLALTRHGLRIHPFGNLITNETAATAFREATGIGQPWIVFRVGVTATPPRSERLRLEEILVE